MIWWILHSSPPWFIILKMWSMWKTLLCNMVMPCVSWLLMTCPYFQRTLFNVHDLFTEVTDQFESFCISLSWDDPLAHGIDFAYLATLVGGHFFLGLNLNRSKFFRPPEMPNNLKIWKSNPAGQSEAANDTLFNNSWYSIPTWFYMHHFLGKRVGGLVCTHHFFNQKKQNSARSRGDVVARQTKP